MTLQLWGRWTVLPRSDQFKNVINAWGQDIQKLSDDIARDFAHRWAPGLLATIAPSMSKSSGSWVMVDVECNPLILVS